MKNKLVDLNNHLFAQLERLGDENLTGEELKQEIARSKAISEVGGVLIEVGKVALDAEKLRAEYGYTNRVVLPEQFENNALPVLPDKGGERA